MNPQTEWVIQKQYNRRHGMPAAFWALIVIFALGSFCVVATSLLYAPPQHHATRGQR